VIPPRWWAQTPARHLRANHRTAAHIVASHPIDKSQPGRLVPGICITSKPPVWTNPQLARIAHRAASSDFTFSELSLPPVPPMRAADRVGQDAAQCLLDLGDTPPWLLTPPSSLVNQHQGGGGSQGRISGERDGRQTDVTCARSTRQGNDEGANRVPVVTHRRHHSGERQTGSAVITLHGATACSDAAQRGEGRGRGLGFTYTGD
jgi:hypothetical protein